MSPIRSISYTTRVVAAYAVLATAWILFSDAMLAFVTDPSAMVDLGIYKGLFFVVLTTALLYVALSHVPRAERLPGAVDPVGSIVPYVGLIAAMGAIVVIAHVVYRAEAESMRQAELRERQAVVANKAATLARWLQERRIDASVVTDDLPRRAAVARWLARGEDADRADVEASLRLVRLSYGYAGIALVDRGGRFLIGDRPAVGEGDAFAEAVGRATAGEIAFLDLHRRADGALHLGFVAPIRAQGTGERTLLALAVLDIRAEDTVFRLLAATPSKRPSEETVLARVDGDDIVVLYREHGGRWTSSEERIARTDPVAPIARHVRTGETVLTGTDHRGAAVLAAASRLPVSGWALLARIDEQEALADLRSLAGAAGFSIAVAFGACLALAYFLWQRHRLRAVADELEHRRRADVAEGRFRRTFEQVPVGICHVGLDGRLIRFNPALCTITGYTVGQLEHMTVDDVMHSEERAPVAQSLARLASGEIAATNSERRICRADGSVALVSIGATLVRDAGDDAPYVVAVVENVTERRAAEAALRASEERFDLAMRGANDGVWDWTCATGAVYFSPRWKTMLGYEPDEIADRIESFYALLHPDEVAIAQQRGEEALAGRSDTLVGEYRLRAKSGEWRHVLSRGFVVRGPDGRASRIVGTHVDLTEQKRAETELRQAAAVFTNTQEGVVVTDPDGRVVTVNPAFTTITGWSPEEVVGRNMNIVSSGLHDRAFYEEMWRSVVTTGHWQGEIWNRRRDGEVYPEWLIVSTVRDDDGVVTHRIGTFSDISSMKRSEARLAHLAQHDPLTDLPNRAMLLEMLGRSIEQASAAGGLGAVLFLDFDRFKNVNDSLGHAAGDELLLLAADRLAEDLPRGALLARLGGDEFVGLLPAIESRKAAAALARRWVERLDRPFALSGARDASISGSIGIAVFPEDGTLPEEILQHADAALYAAKGSGGRTHRFYDETLTVAASDRLAIEVGLRRALERGELELRYQPLVSLADGRVHGAEALLRWRDPVRGLVGPERFMAVAETTGLILPIGQWVLTEACRQMGAWRDAGLDLDLVAVNLSPREFQLSDIVRRVAAALAETGLPARCLEIEITEGALMEQGRDADRRLAELKGIGVRLAIDDFGTGYSSLAYLRRLPIDKLKIDRSFVAHIETDATARQITATIVSLGRTLGLEVLAEGVETEGQSEHLRAMGCDAAQGYLFARPVTAGELPLLLGRRLRPVEDAPRRSAG